MADTTVVEVDDHRWEELAGDGVTDPYCGRSYLAAVTAAQGHRAVLVSVEAPAWCARYPIVLRPLPQGRWLARTPEYGGPFIRVSEARDDRAGAAARECRRAVDEALAALGVVSEVFVLSPWLPHRGTVAAAWSASPGKSVCVVRGWEPRERWARLRKGRRSDIARARRELRLTVGPLGPAAARQFAGRYGAAMDRVGAADRWRLDEQWFAALAARAGERVLAVTAEGAQGGATALFLRGQTTGAYFLASRWGQATGAPSLALWAGLEELAGAGATDVTLGGGASDEDDDPVLAFKRSFADAEERLLVGARVFDARAHDEAVAAGQARPLPDGAVAA